jgi:hypothetical protein
MRVEFDFVAEIPLDASGKYRTVVNKIGIDSNRVAARGDGSAPR